VVSPHFALSLRGCVRRRSVWNSKGTTMGAYSSIPCSKFGFGAVIANDKTGLAA